MPGCQDTWIPVLPGAIQDAWMLLTTMMLQGNLLVLLPRCLDAKIPGYLVNQMLFQMLRYG